MWKRNFLYNYNQGICTPKCTEGFFELNHHGTFQCPAFLFIWAWFPGEDFAILHESRPNKVIITGWSPLANENPQCGLLGKQDKKGLRSPVSVLKRAWLSHYVEFTVNVPHHHNDKADQTPFSWVQQMFTKICSHLAFFSQDVASPYWAGCYCVSSCVRRIAGGVTSPVVLGSQSACSSIYSWLLQRVIGDEPAITSRSPGAQSGHAHSIKRELCVHSCYSWCQGL